MGVVKTERSGTLDFDELKKAFAELKLWQVSTVATKHF